MLLKPSLYKHIYKILTASVWLWSTCSFSQKALGYIWPIDSPFVVTGNYGELRPNHFHAGIDFSTGGQINLPVYAVEEGYVSRVRVSTGGYGKCVYLTHPKGKVTVYAHLNAFSLKIDKLVKEQQYAAQSYEVELLPRPRTVYVRKNEIIGLSGNTGGSTGPHLHFEIRDELTEVPLNPLEYYRLKDKAPPEIEYLGLYNLADTSSPKFMKSFRIKTNSRDSLYLDHDHIVLDQAIVGLAFSGQDRLYPNGNANNIFAARIYFDDRLMYAHQLSGIAFSESRYINEFSQNIGKNKFQKCFLPTLYPAGFYDHCFNKGRILLSDSNFHKVNIIVSDEGGNERNLQFYLKTEKFNYYEEFSPGEMVDCNAHFRSVKNGLYLNIPAGTLYYSIPLVVENTIEANGRLKILPAANLRQPVEIGFKVPEKLLRSRDKLVLRNASTVTAPVSRNDSVFFSIKNFDWYLLGVDSIPPRVKTQYSSKKLKDAWKMDAFSFVISDNLSGIAKYSLWLNNVWVLAEYDAKSDLLTYYFDEETPIGLLQFRLEVEDRVGNKTTFEYQLKK